MVLSTSAQKGYGRVGKGNQIVTDLECLPYVISKAFGAFKFRTRMTEVYKIMHSVKGVDRKHFFSLSYSTRTRESETS